MNPNEYCHKHQIEKRYLQVSQKYQCSICNREKMTEYRLNNPDKWKEIQKKSAKKRRDFVKIDRIHNPEKYFKKIKPKDYCDKHKKSHVLMSDGVLVCKECKKDYQKEYRKNDERYIRNTLNRRLKKFDITEEELNNLRKKYDNKCHICLNLETKIYAGKIIDLSIDHCHESGNVRGLLCHACNTSLGGFKDDINLLKSAIIYLQKYITDE